MYVIISNGELYHHGIKGMRWGVRRYQNKDGSLKAAGRKRYTEGDNKQLTDEERAARNAKIKKAAVAVGAVAATAALAYVGHKYVKHLDSETSDIVKKARDNAIADNFEIYEYDMRGAKSLKERNNLDWQLVERNRRVRANSDEKGYSRDIAKSVVRNDLQNTRDRILRRKPKNNAYRDHSVLDATRKLHNRVDTEMYLKDYLARVDKDRNYRDAAAEALLEKRFKKYGSVNL